MTKDNLIALAVIMFLGAGLILVTKAVLNNNSTRNAEAAPNHLANGASTTSKQADGTPVSSGKVEESDIHIWTSEEMQNAQPYPMPILPGNGPTRVGGQDSIEGPQTGAEGGKPTKP